MVGDLIVAVTTQPSFASFASLAPVGAAGLPGWSQLDDRQRSAVLAPGAVRRVVGAPGTGKTTIALHCVLHGVDAHGLDPQECLLIASSRVQATRLREQLSRALRRTTTQVSVRTLESLAFSLVRAAAPEGQVPQLITGAEQDVILSELMAGHAAGVGRAPAWPPEIAAATATRGLRAELRELIMRVTEHGVDAQELRALAESSATPAWRAAADVLAEYEEVTALSRAGACDPGALLAQATRALDDGGAAALAARLRLVVVDDAQELTVAGVALLTRLAALGVRLVLVGDPDAATQTFRGARPEAIGQAWSGEGLSTAGREPGADEPVVLRTCHRAGPRLVAVADRVSAQIGSGGVVSHRRPVPVGSTSGSAPTSTPTQADDTPDSSPDRASRALPDERGPAGAGAAEQVGVVIAASAAHEARHVAAVLRRARYGEGVPWEQLAVIVRSGAQAADLRRALASEQVPVTVPGARVPLRDEAAVRPLLTLLELSLTTHPQLCAHHVHDLLTSRLVGADSLQVRAVRRALRRRELARAGSRSSDELLVAAVTRAESDPARDLPAPLRRLVLAIDAGRRRAGLEPLGSPAHGCPSDDDSPRRPGSAGSGADPTTPSAAPRGGRRAGVDEVLWAIWSALGLAPSWREQALRGGAAGARADRDLDAVCALFEAADRYVERLPGSNARGFLDHVHEQEVAADSLAARRVRPGEVTLTTPPGAVGCQWHTVVVAGVQEGVWPDLRPRGSTLEVPRLVDMLGGQSAVDEVDRLRRARHDEARLLLVAVSRARHRLLVTAVRDEESQPSPYLDLIDPRAHGGAADAPRPVTPAQRPLTVSGVVADLRRRLATERDEDVRAALAQRLARFADAGVPTADPQRWWAGHTVTDARPVRPAGARVSVSPSRVEAFTRCGLRWLLTSCGGRSAHESTPVAVGNLVHEIAAEVDNSDDAAMQAALRERWPRLGLGRGWLVDRHFDLAATMLTRLARYDAAARRDGWTVVGRELPARVDVGRATVTGRVDRLERDDEGRLRVVDLKTGAGKPARGDVPRLPQLGAYQVAVACGAFAEHGEASAGAALLQLGKAAGGQATLQVQPALAADDEPAWARALVEDVAEGMAADRFEARFGEGCRTCPAFDSCPLQATRWSL